MHVVEIVPEHLLAQQMGISRYCYGACESLAALGHEVDVVTGPCPVREAHLPVCGFRLHPARIRLPEIDAANALRDLNTLFIAEALQVAEVFGRPDLLHVHGCFSALAAACLKDVWNVPVVVHCHYSELGLSAAMSDPQRAASYQAKLEQWLFDLADVIICPSQSIYQELRKANRVPSRKLTVVPNGFHIPTAVVNRQVAHVRSLFGDQRDKVLLYAGRLSPEKGPQVLMEAFRHVNFEAERLRLVFVGMGPLESDLMAAAARIGAAGRVVFTGHLDTPELFQMFAVCDVLVLPSLYEAFGLVAGEAMSLGTPIVASDVGGLSELMRDGESALLVPPGDPKALAATLSRILRDDELRARLGAGARQRVERCFSWNVIAPQLADVLSSLPKGGRHVGAKALEHEEAAV